MTKDLNYPNLSIKIRLHIDGKGWSRSLFMLNGWQFLWAHEFFVEICIRQDAFLKSIWYPIFAWWPDRKHLWVFGQMDFNWTVSFINVDAPHEQGILEKPLNDKEFTPSFGERSTYEIWKAFLILCIQRALLKNSWGHRNFQTTI